MTNFLFSCFFMNLVVNSISLHLRGHILLREIIKCYSVQPSSSFSSVIVPEKMLDCLHLLSTFSFIISKCHHHQAIVTPVNIYSHLYCVSSSKLKLTQNLQSELLVLIAVSLQKTFRTNKLCMVMLNYIHIFSTFSSGENDDLLS